MKQKSLDPTEDRRNHATSGELAMDRTLLARERPLMAWIRTAFSMISFGFAIFKFFQYLGESVALDIAHQGTGARNLGVTPWSCWERFL